MSQEDRYDLKFEVDGVPVEAQMQYLPGEVEALIKNNIAKSDFGTAEVTLVVGATKKLYVDGEYRNLQANRPFPRLRDPETGESLLALLVREIVAKEPWLAQVAPFSRVFARYETDAKPTRSGSLKEVKTGN